MTPDLAPLKAITRRDLLPEDPARVFVETFPDSVDGPTYKSVCVALRRLLASKRGGPPG